MSFVNLRTLPCRSNWIVSAVVEDDASYSVAVSAPALPEIQELPSSLYVTLRGLRNLKLFMTWSVRDLKPDSLKYDVRMRMSGKARNKGVLESLMLEEIRFEFKSQPSVMYQQIFRPFMTYDAIGTKNLGRYAF